MINESEMELFEILSQRENNTALDAAIELALRDERFEHLLSQNLTNEKILLELSSILEKTLKINPNIAFLDMRYYAFYNPKSGFKFAIDGLHNLPKEGFFVTAFCLNPPGALYNDTGDRLQVNFNSSLDWTSPAISPRYIDGYMRYRDINFSQNLCYIIDVREIKIHKKGVEIMDYGWTILPVFTYDGYVNSGVYQLPLFKGAVKKIVLQELEHSKEPWKKMISFMEKRDNYTNKKILELLEPASVVVRLLDGQREGHFKISFDHRRIDYSYLPDDKYYSYSYNEAVAKNLKKKKKLIALKPKKMTELQLNTKITDSVIEALKLTHYTDLKKL